MRIEYKCLCCQGQYWRPTEHHKPCPVGCKADIVFVRTDTFKAAPIYDPFKFLVLSASGDDVDRVIVDGTTIVEGGRVLTVDMPRAVTRLNDAARAVRERVVL